MSAATIAILGAGRMGRGIALAFARGGVSSALLDVKPRSQGEFEALRREVVREIEETAQALVAIGDAPAHRVGIIARAVQEQAQRTGRNLLDTFTEYFLDERPQLVRKSALDAFNAELSKARDALARVEKRIERIERQTEQSRPASGASARSGGESVRDSHE